MGTYPGKAANQDAYVMQSIAPLDERPGTGQSGAPATVGRDDLRAEAGGDAIIGVYDGHGRPQLAEELAPRTLCRSRCGLARPAGSRERRRPGRAQRGQP